MLGISLVYEIHHIDLKLFPQQHYMTSIFRLAHHHNQKKKHCILCHVLLSTTAIPLKGLIFLPSTGLSPFLLTSDPVKCVLTLPHFATTEEPRLPPLSHYTSCLPFSDLQWQPYASIPPSMWTLSSVYSLRLTFATTQSLHKLSPIL